MVNRSRGDGNWEVKRQACGGIVKATIFIQNGDRGREPKPSMYSINTMATNVSIIEDKKETARRKEEKIAWWK